MDCNKASHNGFWLQQHSANGSFPSFFPFPSHVKYWAAPRNANSDRIESWQHAMMASDHDYSEIYIIHARDTYIHSKHDMLFFI